MPNYDNPFDEQNTEDAAGKKIAPGAHGEWLHPDVKKKIMQMREEELKKRQNKKKKKK